MIWKYNTTKSMLMLILRFINRHLLMRAQTSNNSIMKQNKLKKQRSGRILRMRSIEITFYQLDQHQKLHILLQLQKLNQYTLKKLKSKNLKNLKNQSHFPNNKHKRKFRLRKRLSKKKKNLKSLWPILKLGLTSKRRSQRSSNKLI